MTNSINKYLRLVARWATERLIKVENISQLGSILIASKNIIFLQKLQERLISQKNAENNMIKETGFEVK